MNQPLKILVIFLSLTLFSQLTGCVSEEPTPSDAQYFYGLWAGKLNEGTPSEINLSYRFYENNSYLYTIGAQQALGSWELTDGHLVLTIAEKSESFNYTFSDNYTTLLLDPVKFDFSYIVYKQ